MEERMLVKRAKRGDVDAFGELYQRIYKKLYAYALYTLKNPEDAEDAVSQAVVDAYQSIGQLKKTRRFRTGCIGSWQISAIGKCASFIMWVEN